MWRPPFKGVNKVSSCSYTKFSSFFPQELESNPKTPQISAVKVPNEQENDKTHKESSMPITRFLQSAFCIIITATILTTCSKSDTPPVEQSSQESIVADADEAPVGHVNKPRQIAGNIARSLRPSPGVRHEHGFFRTSLN
jgi:hypothetical protein